MCRLYGFIATHPNRVECDLLEAQNSLIRQSQRDDSGRPNEDGWGLGIVRRDGQVALRREINPAGDSAAFREDASRVRAPTVVAHVRRATVGGALPENTHPFRHREHLFAYQGHVGRFDQVRPLMLRNTRPIHREALKGETDGEHLFRLLVSRWEEDPGTDRLAVLRGTLQDLLEWHGEVAADGDGFLAVNVLWVRGHELVGCRINDPLYLTRRDRRHACQRCAPEYDEIPAEEEYRAAAVASEPVTDEEWHPIPDRSVFRIRDPGHVAVRPIREEDEARRPEPTPGTRPGGAGEAAGEAAGPGAAAVV